ncbi:helix-turn-helix domain-containing protein [Flavivirga jejuensis]|uniref:Helix-turn-helix transcriptional regulator n=1 Tax=Flavivirga jejuensis TaxID=870487 RepID=A0ABT8WML9_9FLAO|nr:helix-turn-helix transcriptional regulator [Flavivirga jejuensis]MDO5974401.1 helix-turn-helix transcriptional regulator [Flavivirga jejuensis]
MVFKEKLKQLIKSKYSRYGDLADKFNMNYTQLSQYINGKKISIEFLHKIIDEFPEVDLNWLLRNDNMDSLQEGMEAYKVPLTKKQIIDRIEALVVELKAQTQEE